MLADASVQGFGEPVATVRRSATLVPRVREDDNLGLALDTGKRSAQLRLMFLNFLVCSVSAISVGRRSMLEAP